MVNYAKEYGIEMHDLWQEHPTHPIQTRLRRGQEAVSDNYWGHIERINELSVVGIEHARQAYAEAVNNPPKLVARKPAPSVANQKRKPAPPKTIKVGRYEFTERQFEVAMKALEKRNEQKATKN
jgi:hypothetical protein